MANVSKKEARKALAAQVAADRAALAQGQGAEPAAPRTDLRSGGSIIVTPASNAAAVQARQEEVARAQARVEATRDDPDRFMVRPHPIAGFELAEIFAEWGRRGQVVTVDDLLAKGGVTTLCGGLGLPWMMSSETPEQFGDRIARGILALLKEV